jgi:plasmid stability protein
MGSTITIRNLPDKDKRALKKRAALNGRSMEAEARAIIGEAITANGASATGRALKPREKSKLSPEAEAALARLQKMFAPKPGEKRTSLSDELIAERRAEAAKE